MLITFNVKKIARIVIDMVFRKSKPIEEFIFDQNLYMKEIDLVTIAFNNEKVIKYQIAFIKKNLTDRYCYTIVDNSTDSIVAEKIKDICIRNKINYIRLRKNRNTESNSHGTALNWVYYNFILKRRLKFFGFLDHDIFPIAKTSIVNILNLSESGCFGPTIENDKRWFIWAGFCFFNLSKLKTNKLNFMPRNGLDTGGMNWYIIYKYLRREDLPTILHEHKKFTQGQIRQIDDYEIFNSVWLHSINASQWFNSDCEKKKRKEILLENLLNKYLQD